METLDVLVKQHGGSFQSSLVLLRDEVAGGSGLADTQAAVNTGGDSNQAMRDSPSPLAPG